MSDNADISNQVTEKQGVTMKQTPLQAVASHTLAFLIGVFLTGVVWATFVAVTPESDGTQVVAGTDKRYLGGDSFLAYECAPGYKAVQVPVSGVTTQVDGAEYTATQIVLNGVQTEVNFTVKLPSGVAAPTMIVNSERHVTWPTLAGNDKVKISLKPGGYGNYAFVTTTYGHELNGRIADILVCTEPAK